MSEKPYVCKFLLVLCSVIGLAAVIMLAVVHYETTAYEHRLSITRRFCDGSFVSAVILLSCGCLTFVTREGAFTSISYAFHCLIRRFIPSALQEESYYEYVSNRKNRPKQRTFLAFLIGGMIMLTMAFFFFKFEQEV